VALRTAPVSAQVTLTVSAGGPYSGTAGQPVQFIAQLGGTGRAILTWSFGDGSSGVGRGPQQTYSVLGVCTVTLVATNGGVTAQNTTFAVITAPSQSSLTVSAGGPYTGSAGQPVTLMARANVAGASLLFLWDFGDGASGSGSTVTHAYAAPGTYLATVTVSGAPGVAADTVLVAIGAAAPTGPAVSYAAGWNLVGGPAGATFPQANGPLYTFQAGNTAYQSIPNTQGIIGGNGYWAYFSGQTSVSFNGDSTSPVTVQAPANQYIMVGNPSVTGPATVTGADVVYIYDAVASAYATSPTIPPGAGAWVLRGTAGGITITPNVAVPATGVTAVTGL
jgi:PKD repeat protein